VVRSPRGRPCPREADAMMALRLQKGEQNCVKKPHHQPGELCSPPLRISATARWLFICGPGACQLLHPGAGEHGCGK